MKTHVERLPDHPARVLLEVEVEPERVERAVDQVYRRVVRTLRIPGFRPGRAPRKIVEMHVGKEALLQEALEDLIPELYREAAREADIHPVAQAEIDIVDFGDGVPLKFKAEVDVKPDVTLGEYKSLAVEKRIRKVTDEHVANVLERLRQGQARLVTSEKEALEEGDFAVIDYDGFIDDEAFPGGAGRGETVEVGPGGFLPGFSEQLVGMKLGEEREIEVQFPEDAREDVAGKTAKLVVRLQEMKVRVEPELDDELAKDLGEFDTLEELRADARKRLEDAAAADAAMELESTVIKLATDAATVDIPEVMIEQEIEQMERELQLSLARSGLRLQDYLEMNEITREQLTEDLRPGAEQRVKSDLVLEAIARAEGLQVTEAEVDERMRELLGPGRDEKELEKMLADEDRRDVSRNSLLRMKAIQWLVDNAQVTEVEYDPAEEEEQAEGEGDGASAAGDEVDTTSTDADTAEEAEAASVTDDETGAVEGAGAATVTDDEGSEAESEGTAAQS